MPMEIQNISLRLHEYQGLYEGWEKKIENWEHCVLFFRLNVKYRRMSLQLYIIIHIPIHI